MGCIYLKYWLYDQITSKGFNGLQIINLFEEFNKHVQGKIQGISKDYCKFNQLSLDQIKKIKKVYALNSILHESDKNPETCVNNHCKYMDYFEEALTEFINSIKKCADNPLEKEYCDEFEDFLKICTGGNSYTGVSIYNRHIGTSDDSNRKYLLSVKNYKNQPLYIYIKDNKWLNWGEISHIVNPQNTATIAATSVVGSAIGLSSIFYYFYKVNLNLI
ncbi:hypothetical protein PVIIG_05613 [Plasmodium vivax India VII]|uniref:VIR protein n=1 Tax=Plasmodium vivax India VII TaxID=1077284 RepID=A0A0J9S2Y0_PLAVI|nr:hypothetical protein PVIIG_05613 [Plasmodium vivax India VII]